MIHGQSAGRNGRKGSRLHRIWVNMLGRCRNEAHDAYPSYGGRGIGFCPQWAEFVRFEQWARSAGYADDLTIDRINNDGDYEPANCRWVDMKVQARNRSANRILTYQGKTACLAEHAEDAGQPYKRVHERLQMGWSIERAMTQPPRQLERHKQ